MKEHVFWSKLEPAERERLREINTRRWQARRSSIRLRPPINGTVHYSNRKGRLRRDEFGFDKI
jgi:hypothetical protein